MTLLCALLLVLSGVEGPVLMQEPVEELKKEIERLKKENQELRQRVTELDGQSLETAETITRLRQAVRLLEEQGPAKTETAKPATPGAEKPQPGPTVPKIGKLVHVNSERGYITIGIGRPQDILVGYRFEIFRETFEPGADLPKRTKLGVAEVEKYIGQDTMSWLKVIEGNVRDMRPDDLAVAIRGLPPVAPPKDAPPPPKDPKESKEPVLDSTRAGAFSITGQTGTSFLLDYGSVHGARQTDIVFAYRDGTLKARLRLDKVDKTYAVANLIAGSQVAGVPPPERGDQIYTRELQKGLAGKVSFLNAKEGSLAVDLRPRDGIKAGQRYEVRRNGAKVGTILITDVQSWGSWAKPDGDTKYEEIQKGDFVQVIEEK